MGDKSNIEWTDATWNPIVGCSIVSPGCTNCYAMRQAQRIELMSDGAHSKGAGRRIEGSSHYAGTTKEVNGNPVWTGKLALAPNHILTAPLRWKKPRMIFVNSMGDLFHDDCPNEWIDRVFAVMALCPQHTFQVLTKRAKRMRDYIGTRAGDYEITLPDIAVQLSASPCAAHVEDVSWPLPNVWLGVSTEDQKRADERIPDLLHTPAAIRFISAEPLLDPLNLQKISLGTSPMTIAGDPQEWTAAFFMDATRGVNKGAIPPLNWVIVGGESGRGARPMHPDWARSLRDQCASAGVPYFFKQWGEWQADALLFTDALGNRPPMSMKIGKHRAGRLLDGREHNGMPEVRR